MKRRLMNTILVIVVVLVVFALYLRWNEPRMLYYPLREIAQTPADVGWEYEDVWLTTADNVRLHGWYLPAGTKATRTILFFHGNAGNLSHRLEKFDILRGLGAHVFAIDYRGYGRSEGVPNEAGTYADAEAAYEHITGQPTRPVIAENLLIYGESLGAAIAVELATRHRVGGVILEAPFTSVAAIGQKMFPFLPIRLLVRNKYDTLSKIARIGAPLLILHSPADEVIPFDHATRLLDAARVPKLLVHLDGGHNEAFLESESKYRDALAGSIRGDAGQLE